MSLSDTPRRCAVIGHPVAHSRSPDIHAAFARQTGVALHYERIDAPPDRFEAIASDFFERGGCGLNVTVPFKERATRWAGAGASARARRAGAANTLWFADGTPQACNTDGVGLLTDLHRLLAWRGDARILLIGAGGAARGALMPLLEATHGPIRICNRSPERAQALVDDFSDTPHADRLEASDLSGAARRGGWDIVVNASASSLSGAAPAVPGGLYAPDALAYDMMYAAQPTAFMQQALSDGATHVADGLGMLVAQAAESFHIWHGVRPDIAPVLDMIRAQMTAPAA